MYTEISVICWHLCRPKTSQ